MFRVFSQRDGRGHLKNFYSSVDAGLTLLPYSKTVGRAPVLDTSNSINAGLVGRWLMYEGSGTSDADLSANAKNLALSSGAAWATGASGQPVVAVSTGAMTATMSGAPTAALNAGSGIHFSTYWRGSMTNLTQSQTYLWDWGGNGLCMLFGYVSGKIELYSSDSNVRSGTAITIPDTGEHAVFYTYDGTNLVGYLDGTQVFSLSKSLTLAGNATLTLGRTSGTNQNAANWDQFALWNRALSASEVAQLTSISTTGIK